MKRKTFFIQITDSPKRYVKTSMSWAQIKKRLAKMHKAQQSFSKQYIKKRK